MEPIVSRLDVTTIFCDVDDFCQRFEQVWSQHPQLPMLIGCSNILWDGAEARLDGSLATKLHLIINERGELLAFKLTPANTDDRKPVPEMTPGKFCQLFGDRGNRIAKAV